MHLSTLLDMIDSRKQELFDLLSSLIKINSENFGDHGNEQACAEFIRDLCVNMGLETEMYSPLELDDFENHPDYFPGRHLENRYNVTAKWNGTENNNKMMLMGHLDTVMIGDPANWDMDPLSGAIKDGYIHGRGACDDKYSLAASLFLIRLLKEAGFTPKQNLLLNAYCDEELGGSHGALAAVLKDPCEITVNMDGRISQIWHCASGGQVVNYRYQMRGTCDSAERTAQLLPVVMEVLQRFAQHRRDELEANPYYAGTNIPSTSMRYNEIRAGNNDMDKHIGVLQFTFYTDKTKEAIWEEFSQLNETLQKTLEPMGADSLGFEAHTRFFHYGACPKDDPEILSMLQAIRESGGTVPLVCGACLSDLSVILKHAGKHVVNYGAGIGFSEAGGAHQPNERISCDVLLAFTKAIAAYILRTLG